MKSLHRPHASHTKTAAITAVEDLAAAILRYLAAEPDRMMRFFDLTGLAPHALREAAGQASFAASLFEYLASDDRLLLAFAAETGKDPKEIEAIRLRIAHASGGS